VVLKFQKNTDNTVCANPTNFNGQPFYGLNKHKEMECRLLNKASEMAKSSARGGFKLFLGLSISSVVTAVSLVVVLRLLANPDDYGIITTALIFPLMLSLFKDWGMNSAMVKFLAQYKFENETDKIKNVLLTGMLFELILGVFLTLLCFLLADFLATSVFHRPEVKVLIEVASFTILADSFLKISQSTFIGLERLEFHSLTQILYSSMRCLLAPLLVWYGYGVMGAIQGQIVAQVTAGGIGILIFYYSFLKKYSKNQPMNKKAIKETLKTMLIYGVPLNLSAITTGFLPQFYNTVLTQSFPEAAYTTALGNFQAAVNFTVIVTFFTIPINTMLFPAFSKLREDKEKQTLRTIFQTSVKYGALLIIPVTLLIMTLSEPMVFAVVGTQYTEAPFFLSLYITTFLLAGMGNLSLASFLNGQGKTRISMRLALITLSVGLLLGWTLVSQFGVVGLIVTNILAGVPSLIAGLWWIRKNYGATINWISSAKIFLASVIATGATHLLLTQLNFGYWIEMIVGGISFLSVYLIISPLIRAVEKTDITSLREMLSGLGPFSYFFNIPLAIMEKLLGIFKS
jgi:O-antigen/teichoic acid export membrane protein